MTDIHKKKSIRVPVKFVDGHWEYFYGGNIPAKNGAIGDLVLNEGAIDDKDFLKSLNRKSRHKILDEGANLLVALTIRPETVLDKNLKKHLYKQNDPEKILGPLCFNKQCPAGTQFIEIILDKTINENKELPSKSEGGLWLNIQGLQSKGIVTSNIDLPNGLTGEPVISLNHAFTILSEHYEPWRKSHTGNIYERVFYQEKNGKWYQLEILRNIALAKDEHKFIKERWAEITSQLNLKIN